jgi:hypothetical protein
VSLDREGGLGKFPTAAICFKEEVEQAITLGSLLHFFLSCLPQHSLRRGEGTNCYLTDWEALERLEIYGFFGLAIWVDLNTKTANKPMHTVTLGSFQVKGSH